MSENLKRTEPGNQTIYVTVDKKIVGKLFMIASPEIVQSFVDDVNDNSPHYVLLTDNIRG